MKMDNGFFIAGSIGVIILVGVAGRGIGRASMTVSELKKIREEVVGVKDGKEYIKGGWELIKSDTLAAEIEVMKAAGASTNAIDRRVRTNGGSASRKIVNTYRMGKKLNIRVSQ